MGVRVFASFLFTVWSLILCGQVYELVLNFETFWMTQQWMVVLLFACAYFVLVGVPLSVLVMVFFGRFSVRVRLALVFLVLCLCQFWLLQKVYYQASVLYWLGFVLIGVLVILSLPRWQRFWQQFPVVLLLGVGILEWHGASSSVVYSVDEERPNVLVIVADTLRQDHTSFMGYERDTTPFLDELARQSVVFENAVSTSSWTKPAMASFFTGLWLADDAVHIRHLGLGHRQKRLAQSFQEAGYQTAFFSANPNTSNYLKGARGFDYVVQPKPAPQFSLYRFVLPRFLNYQGGLPKRVQFENVRRRLEWYRKDLGLAKIEDLVSWDSSFSSTGFVEQYRKMIDTLWPQYQALKAEVDQSYHKLWTPLSEWFYKKVLEFSYIKLWQAKGHMVTDHWITDAELSDDFITWLGKHHDKNKPFLAHLQYMGPHNPYHMQPPHLLPHFDADSSEVLEMPPSKHVFVSQGAPELPERQLYNLKANYDDAIRITDANIKRVAEALEQKGILDNTLIVFLSDHGEAFYEHGIYDHMYSLHAEMINIPLFFHWPQKLKASRTKAPASIADIYPTLLQLTKIPATDLSFDGEHLFNEGYEPRFEDLKDRTRYVNVHLGFKPKPTWGLKNLFTKKKRHDHQPLRGHYTATIKGNEKHVIETEYPANDPTKKTTREFYFDLNNPAEPRIQR